MVDMTASPSLLPSGNTPRVDAAERFMHSANRSPVGFVLSEVARQLERAPYLLGDQLSVADIYLLVVLGWGAYVNLDLSPWPALQARVVGRTEPWVRPPGHGAAMPERERQCRDWLRANGRSARHWRRS